MSYTDANKEPNHLKTVHLNIDADATEEERKEIIKWFNMNFNKKED